MRILICDDNPLMIEQLNKYIIEYFHHNSLKIPKIISFSNGEDLLNDSGEKDILFLDIEMPGLDGIYVGNELKQIYPNLIIFIVTSYIEYLDEAMRFHVFRYLSKPLDKKRLFRNIKDALQLYNATNIKIPIETKDGVHTVSASDIICVEAQGRKVIVHTTDKDFNSLHHMKYWITTLPKQLFFQSHRSFLVNFEHITNFDHSLIHLYNNLFTAYLTRRKYTAFKESYLLYLEGKQ